MELVIIFLIALQITVTIMENHSNLKIFFQSDENPEIMIILVLFIDTPLKTS